METEVRPIRVTAEFRGRFKDGEVYRSDSEDKANSQQAWHAYLLSHRGKLGSRFRSVSDDGRQGLEEIIRDSPEFPPKLSRAPSLGMNHIYEVAERIEEDGHLIIRFQYKGQEPTPDKA